jgi:signal transduction histidine kinase
MLQRLLAPSARFQVIRIARQGRHAARKRSVTEAAGPVTATGDSSLFRQLVTNLLDNALRFRGPEGSVALRVGRGAGLAMMRVRDTEPGIPPEHLPHVFERFYQADAARGVGRVWTGSEHLPVDRPDARRLDRGHER